LRPVTLSLARVLALALLAAPLSGQTTELTRKALATEALAFSGFASTK
jgi:uncharacterized protein YbjT (DUF2867 family)